MLCSATKNLNQFSVKLWIKIRKRENDMNKRTTYLMTILGTMVTGFAIGSFLTPNKIVGGGASGISTILFHTFGIQPGISFFIINIF